ncbi:hypothetical protein C1H46_005427 [Malus baccata]|uniref:Uncharacterized protein n=1 Tax=Malus baccata TaxID=106549 RepID=A0A540NDC2_MALBA|nr:hypothetical protein C1H46_005427 [Malus baccata]
MIVTIEQRKPAGREISRTTVPTRANTIRTNKGQQRWGAKTRAKALHTLP